MIQRIDKNDFVRAFDDFNRSENFTREAREALYDYLEEIDENIELDVIAVCCDYTEYADEDEAREAYGDDWEDYVVIRLDNGGFICQG
ncbi:MAG: hypothetical protein WC476_13000 [Phycisphaerae bacterium]|jgi:hypothetical protein